MAGIIEVRAYNLLPGAREHFHRLVTEESLPMLKRWNVEVVAFGPSPQDDSSYYLIRAYASLEERQQSQDAFYNSDEWKQGPREAIIGCIENSTSIVLPANEQLIQSLRQL